MFDIFFTCAGILKVRMRNCHYYKKRLPKGVGMARLVGEDCDVVAELAAGATVVGRGPLLKVQSDLVFTTVVFDKWAWQ